MKTFYTLLSVIALTLVACSSSQNSTYRPVGSNEANWEVSVIYKNGITDNFKVIINDSTVIDKSANMITGNLEEKGTYRGNTVKLLVSHHSGFLGIGEGYDAIVFINNELVGKYSF